MYYTMQENLMMHGNIYKNIKIFSKKCLKDNKMHSIIKTQKRSTTTKQLILVVCKGKYWEILNNKKAVNKYERFMFL